MSDVSVLPGGGGCRWPCMIVPFNHQLVVIKMAHCFLIRELWGYIAKDFYWKSKHTGQFMDYNFDVTKGEIYIKCMEGATTNICYNVLDCNVHERGLGDKVAFYWCVSNQILWVTHMVSRCCCEMLVTLVPTVQQYLTSNLNNSTTF